VDRGIPHQSHTLSTLLSALLPPFVLHQQCCSPQTSSQPSSPSPPSVSSDPLSMSKKVVRATDPPSGSRKMVRTPDPLSSRQAVWAPFPTARVNNSPNLASRNRSARASATMFLMTSSKRSSPSSRWTPASTATSSREFGFLPSFAFCFGQAPLTLLRCGHIVVTPTAKGMRRRCLQLPDTLSSARSTWTTLWPRSGATHKRESL
jgi:hypothetical protein